MLSNVLSQFLKDFSLFLPTQHSASLELAVQQKLKETHDKEIMLYYGCKDKKIDKEIQQKRYKGGFESYVYTQL